MQKRMDDLRKKMNRMGKQGAFLFILDYELQKPLLLALSEVEKHAILYDFKGKSNCGPRQELERVAVMEKQPVSFETYECAFSKVMKQLLYGNSFLVNLTMPTRIGTNLCLLDIFHTNKQPYRLLMGDERVVFSPETFVTIKNGMIKSFPMKGTIDAAIDHAEEKLLSDPKEMAEHATIVDLIRNDLSIVARDVKVERYRYVEKVRTSDKSLLQVSTEISGQLPNDWKEKVGDIIIPLLPAGSICGAPKAQTLQIIAEAESKQRGYYTGVMGLFDGSELSSAVMIRYVEKEGDQLYYRSGGGITSQSSARSEYQEMIDKVYLPK